jgi:hypothetical protein
MVTTTIQAGRVSQDARTAIQEELKALEGQQVVITITRADAMPGLPGLVTLDELAKMLQHITDLANTHVDVTDINGILDLLNELSAWLPQSGIIQASAKYYLNAAKAQLYDEVPEDIKRSGAMNVKNWIQANAYYYEALYERCERLTAAITHRCDHLRTFVSFEEAE